MDERRQGTVQSVWEAGRVCRVLPGLPREEVEESGAEREKVRPVARVFHQNQFTSDAEHPRDFPE